MSVPSVLDCVGEITQKHILIDTCFFIDYLLSVRHDDASDYNELVSILKNQGNTLTTIFPVAIEFLKGSNLLEDRRKKKDFLNELIKFYLPVTQSIIDYTDIVSTIFREKGSGISPTDFILAATLKQYSKSGMLLLTNDHGDFPVRIFDRRCVVPLQHRNGGVETYAFFQYSNEKEFAIMQDLIKTDARGASKKPEKKPVDDEITL